jgi:hypothetical protein
MRIDRLKSTALLKECVIAMRMMGFLCCACRQEAIAHVARILENIAAKQGEHAGRHAKCACICLHL